MASSISFTGMFRASMPRVLADLGEGRRILRFYGPSTDGRRFLTALAAEEPGGGDSITIRTNWHEEFRDREEDLEGLLGGPQTVVQANVSAR